MGNNFSRSARLVGKHTTHLLGPYFSKFCVGRQVEVQMNTLHTNSLQWGRCQGLDFDFQVCQLKGNSSPCSQHKDSDKLMFISFRIILNFATYFISHKLKQKKNYYFHIVLRLFLQKSLLFSLNRYSYSRLCIYFYIFIWQLGFIQILEHDLWIQSKHIICLISFQIV